jgi:hypothetical protein
MRKLETLKVGGSKEKKNKIKMHIESWKAYFSSCYFFHYSISFALER